MEITPGSALCRDCGFCCDGTIFDRVPITPPEVEAATRCRLPLVPDADDRMAIETPCPAHVKFCTVYEERPSICRTYRCDLLMRVDAEELPLDDAMAHVARVQALVADIRPWLDDPAGAFWPQVDRLAGRSNEWKLAHAGVCLAIITLSETVARFFDARSRRTGLPRR